MMHKDTEKDASAIVDQSSPGSSKVDSSTQAQSEVIVQSEVDEKYLVKLLKFRNMIYLLYNIHQLYQFYLY